MNEVSSSHLRDTDVTRRWLQRLALVAILLAGAATVFVTQRLLMDRFTETTRNRAELRLALYTGNLVSELRQNSIVPQLLARDPALISALSSRDYSLSTQRLAAFGEELGATSLLLLDREGRVVAATDRNRIGASYRNYAPFVDASRLPDTVFTSEVRDSGLRAFSFARRLEDESGLLGVILVEIDLRRFERGWAGTSAAVLVTDSSGEIILATEPVWRGRSEAEALQEQPPQGAIERAVRATGDWSILPPDAYISGQGMIRSQARVPFRGWQMVSFTTYSSVVERVFSVIALEIMGFALIIACAFYWISRRSEQRVADASRESEALRALNIALQNEVVERQRAENDLAVAEQTLEQSSKLAALGEMSAAVSHELNQPLAAMKTYLAGARLLLARAQPSEAAISLDRLDDLIERMGAITKQLKSYARKGQEKWAHVDMAEALNSSLSMMEPQLRTGRVLIERVLPPEPVLVLGDRMRIEQVIVNLLRNAIDASKNMREPRIDLILSQGETVNLTVRDNGPGIQDLDALFEPFYSTKQPGDGVGLGLAISSGIVSDLGGRLVARNGADGGAVFEMQLPALDEQGQDHDKRSQNLQETLPGVAAAQ